MLTADQILEIAELAIAKAKQNPSSSNLQFTQFVNYNNHQYRVELRIDENGKFELSDLQELTN